MKKLYILFILFFLTSCSGNAIESSFSSSTEIHDYENINTLESQSSEYFIDDSHIYNALNSIFINVTSTNTFELPKSIYGHSISFSFNEKEIKEYNSNYKVISGENIKITAFIDYLGQAYQKDFILIFNNNKITKSIQHNLIINYAFLTNNKQKIGLKQDVKQIIVHNTANSASAYREVSYLNSKDNTNSTSFHYAIDDTGIYQAIDTNYSSYHAGNFSVNRMSIGVEMSKSTISDEGIKDKCIENGIKFIRLLKSYYDIDIENIKTHNEITGKHCPHDIMDRYGLEKFISEIKKG